MVKSNAVKLLVEADTKQAEGALDRVGKKAGLSEPLKKSVSGFTDLKSAADLAIGVLGKVADNLDAVWKAAKEGSQLEFTIKKFDRLATSVGTVSDTLLKDLKTATRGTFSDMELAASATDFLTLGLAKSHDEVVRLSRVSSALGMDMNQLVLTLTNQTTMRFDALGISVDGFDAKVAALKKTGLDANAAFTEAFLQQAEAQIERVGDVADTNAGKIMKMEAAGKNLSDALKLQLAPAAGTVATTLTDLITYFEKMKEMFESGNQAAVVGASNYKEYALEIARLAQETDPLNKNLANTVYFLRKTNGAYQENKISVGELRNMTNEELITLVQQEGTLDSLITMLGGYSEGTYAAAGSMDYADRMAQNLAKSTEDLAAKQNDLATKTWSVSDAMSEYTTRLLFNQAAANLNEDEALLLAQSMGLVSDATLIALTKQEELKKQYDDGYLTLDEYVRRTGDLDVAIRALESKNITITTTHIDEYIEKWSTQDNRTTQNFTPGSDPLQQRFAAGGSFMVPPGYANDSYPLGPGRGASSGEVVSISPTFHITQQPGQSGEAITGIVMRRIEELTRRRRLAGGRYIGG